MECLTPQTPQPFLFSAQQPFALRADLIIFHEDSSQAALNLVVLPSQHFALFLCETAAGAEQVLYRIIEEPNGILNPLESAVSSTGPHLNTGLRLVNVQCAPDFIALEHAEDVLGAGETATGGEIADARAGEDGCWSSWVVDTVAGLAIRYAGNETSFKAYPDVVSSQSVKVEIR